MIVNNTAPPGGGGVGDSSGRDRSTADPQTDPQTDPLPLLPLIVGLAVGGIVLLSLVVGLAVYCGLR